MGNSLSFWETVVMSASTRRTLAMAARPALLAWPQFYAQSRAHDVIMGVRVLSAFLVGPRRMPPKPPRTGRRRRSKVLPDSTMT